MLVLRAADLSRYPDTKVSDMILPEAGAGGSKDPSLRDAEERPHRTDTEGWNHELRKGHRILGISMGFNAGGLQPRPS